MKEIPKNAAEKLKFYLEALDFKIQDGDLQQTHFVAGNSDLIVTNVGPVNLYLESSILYMSNEEISKLAEDLNADYKEVDDLIQKIKQSEDYQKLVEVAKKLNANPILYLDGSNYVS